jgi:hypothetical protein
MEFQSLQINPNNRAFSLKKSRGPDLPGLGRSGANAAQIQPRHAGAADSNGWPTGPTGQHLWEAESVRAVPGRPIKWRSTALDRRLRDRRIGCRRG